MTNSVQQAVSGFGVTALRDTRVYVVDDDSAIREEIALLLEREGALTYGFASGSAFINEFPSLPAGVVILDLGLPGLSGGEVLAMLSSWSVAHRVVVLTGHGSIPGAVTTMRQGASDFIEKPLRGRQLLEAVTVAATHLARDVAGGQGRADIKRRIGTLTERERDVLRSLRKGYRNRAIAEELGINVRTVEMHRYNLRKKLGVGTVAEAIAMLVLLEAEDDRGTGVPDPSSRT